MFGKPMLGFLYLPPASFRSAKRDGTRKGAVPFLFSGHRQNYSPKIFLETFHPASNAEPSSPRWITFAAKG
jgi:hypothetical protein